MKRVFLGAAIIATVFGTEACSDAQPCAAASCPSVAGRYRLTWDVPSATGACVARAPTTEALVITQNSEKLTAELEGLSARGTLLDTYDISLSASSTSADGGLDVVALAVRYIPATTPDAGARLRGRLTQTYQRAAATCDVATPVSGVHD